MPSIHSRLHCLRYRLYYKYIREQITSFQRASFYMSKVLDFLTGGAGAALATGAVDIVKGLFPAKLSAEQERTLDLQVTSLVNSHTLEVAKLDMQEVVEFNARIKDLEGTASDLKSIPFIGPLVIFLRGLQRPVWGFGTLYMDYMWFSGSWNIPEESQKGTALIIINLLVLGFLFGERALKNLEPLITKLLARKGS